MANKNRNNSDARIRISSETYQGLTELAELMSKKYGTSISTKQALEMMLQVELKMLRRKFARECIR